MNKLRYISFLVVIAGKPINNNNNNIVVCFCFVQTLYTTTKYVLKIYLQENILFKFQEERRKRELKE